MYDAERDEDPGARPFYVRLLAVAAITVAACGALLPSVTGFSTGVDGERSCVAIVDGWHADHSPTAGERATGEQFLGAQPTPQQVDAVQRANVHIDWLLGPGACVPESRHRLIRTGVGLGSLAMIVAGIAIERRYRMRSHARSIDPVPA